MTSIKNNGMARGKAQWNDESGVAMPFGATPE
jgi:hypothetical protein